MHAKIEVDVGDVVVDCHNDILIILDKVDLETYAYVSVLPLVVGVVTHLRYGRNVGRVEEISAKAWKLRRLS